MLFKTVIYDHLHVQYEYVLLEIKATRYIFPEETAAASKVVCLLVSKGARQRVFNDL